MSEIENNWRRVSLYAPLLIWIGVIFYLSGMGGSFQTTSRFIGPLLQFLFPDASADTLAFYHFLIRKSAHVTAYAILGLLAFRAFVDARFRILVSLIVVAVVAVLDETNQSFNSARTGTMGDVFIDLFGGTTALLTVAILTRRRSHPSSPAPHESAQE